MAPGSSPLSRGIPHRLSSYLSGPGIIPALAGNTVPMTLIRAFMKDHPRSRGEYIPPGTLLMSWSGSSPLSRGILFTSDTVAETDRIIPALAGNTRPGVISRPCARDHPRSRGEYFTIPILRKIFLESSPLSRGIPNSIWTSGRSGGIIPALAGNTHSVIANAFARWDHPRSRGEYCDRLPGRDLLSGSSPLSRGILPINHQTIKSTRIIPALAGNT